MSKQTEINFKLIIIGRNKVKIIEEFRENAVEFSAPQLLKSSFLEDMIAEGFVARLKEIIAEHLKP